MKLHPELRPLVLWVIASVSGSLSVLPDGPFMVSLLIMLPGAWLFFFLLKRWYRNND